MERENAVSDTEALSKNFYQKTIDLRQKMKHIMIPQVGL